MNDSTVFLPSFGNKPAELVGRSEIVENFKKGLNNSVGHPDRASLLVGQRGMGKTALLLEFNDQAERLGFVAARVTATDDLLNELIGTIQLKGSQLIRQRRKVTDFSAGAFGFTLGLGFTDEIERNYSFLNKLSLLADELQKQGSGVVILVDEIQANSAALRTLTAAYQHLVGEGKNIAIVMAGLPHAVSTVLNDDVLTFFNRARKTKLGPLSISTVSVYYAKVFDNLGISITPEMLDAAANSTHGYPYLLQLIGYYLLEFAGKSEAISGERLEMALQNAKRDLVDNVFEPIIKPLSDVDRKFLHAMAKDYKTSRTADLKERLRFSNSMVQVYRKRLIDAGAIAAERRGELAFTLPFFGEYLRGEL